MIRLKEWKLIRTVNGLQPITKNLAVKILLSHTASEAGKFKLKMLMLLLLLISPVLHSQTVQPPVPAPVAPHKGARDPFRPVDTSPEPKITIQGVVKLASGDIAIVTVGDRVRFLRAGDPLLNGEIEKITNVVIIRAVIEDRLGHAIERQVTKTVGE